MLSASGRQRCTTIRRLIDRHALGPPRKRDAIFTQLVLLLYQYHLVSRHECFDLRALNEGQ